jgi:hypothetical protein
LILVIFFFLPFFHFGRVFSAIILKSGFNSDCVNSEHYGFKQLFYSNPDSLAPSAGFSVGVLFAQAAIFTVLAYYISAIRSTDDEHV